MSFRRNYLPSQSQPWAREVQSRIQKSERDAVISDINNKTRDDQLQASYNRLDNAFGQLASQQSTLEAQQSQLQTALNNSTTALNTAINANNNALAALQDVVDLGSPGGPTINASNITAGSISGDRVTGGEIIGTTLKTASSGRRVEIQSTSTAYYDESNNFTGRILGAGTDRGATLELTSGASGAVYIWNGGVISYGAGGTYAGLSDNGFAVGGNRLYTIGANIEADGALVTTGALTRTVLVGGGTTGASITDGGNFVRTSSSERYKTEIQLLDINLNDLYAVEPKTFKRIEEVEEHGEEANVYPGLIAEELAGTSLDKFVFYSNDEEGNPRPEGIHYPELTTALLIALKDLNARVEELENKVK